ncbi:hypothetical protein SSBR45G_35040 [Bradyrhizobium sp. SSBR45G]|uniref:hypothetical protein n=1 Tax=unclassified Bradyrhizobium TaxID=2631580 RepID=UPI0023429215|nr:MULTISPECIES: hypothetical protein [unclassified Bradyrhizobium]GLH78595.1 hypothetical protein SSBR45G_35040 [Bradyrhizobium sp. SSBR45G]GLH86379.1 hypothetical protein SSBR45R_38390 [Bradyrhizobium sp. SSBR45R]
MAEKRIDFGKRRPLPPPPPTPPVKRSGHVALLLMGTLAVGGTAYALMPRQQSCPQPNADTPAMAGPAQATECTTHRSSSSSGGSGSGSGRWGFSSSDSDSRSSGTSHVADASSAHVSRGGFGGFGHGFGFGGG